MSCLIQPIEEEIRTKLGVSFTLLFSFAQKFITDIEEKSTNNFIKLRNVFKAKNIEQLVHSYYSEFPEMKGDKNELIGVLRANNSDLIQAKSMLLSHNEQSFYANFLFDVKDVQYLLPQGYSSRDLITSIEAISLSFGSLKSAKPEHIFLDNPCWKRPVIKLGPDTYFWPLPVLLFSFCHDIVENAISSDKHLLNKYFDRRANFLEDRVASLFESQFPSCEIFRGSLWQDPSSGREYENDLLVLIDCFAVVVEAKSGRVTDPAKRGALSRFERTVDDLVSSASIQSERFAEMIGATKKFIEFDTRNGTKNSVDLSRITKITRLTVLLDDIATIQTRIRELKDAGIINESISVAPTMLISDLETVIDILETPAILLHYLIRRNEIQVNAVMIGDDLDILAFYLDTGFNIGVSEYNSETHLHLTGMSSKIDKYNEFKGRLKINKPSPRLTKWWRDIITQLENRNTYRWLEIAIKLLNVAYEDQVKVEKKFLSIKKQVKGNWFRNGHLNCVMFCCGPPVRQDAFVFLAYRDRHSHKRHEWASNASAAIMEENHLSEALVLGVNIDIGHYPYSFIAMCAPS